ncbi:MAG: response regulator [Bacteroidia bacterium]|nr:response regulator [Bacteroidia bacterium]
MTNQPICILLVEDSEDDALLISREFKRSGLKYIMDRVETEETLLSKLANQDWDIVISDYNLPRFGGLMALQLVKQQDEDLPFILVSGKIGEELAVEIMKAGADDYIMKDNMTRLAPAVLRAINDAVIKHKHRAAEKKIRENEAHLRALFDSTIQAMFLVDKNLRILWLNEMARAFTLGIYRESAKFTI